MVGLGQCAYDVLGRLPVYPEVDSKAELSDLLVQGGGPVATALVTLSRLGVSTAFCGRTGDDDFGLRIRQGLEGEGVHCGGLKIEYGATSQFAFIAVEKTARRTIFWHRGTARPLGAQELDADLLGRCRVLHLDGLQHEASMEAARIARSAGGVTVLDGGSLRDGTRELLPLIDHLVVSEKFCRQAAPSASTEEALRHLLAFGAEAVTITCGERGSHTLARDGQRIDHPAFRVAAVDTTGCGDVFHGGYIFGLLQGWPLARTVRFAAACAALKARALGGRTAIPRLREVEVFLSKPGRFED